MKRQNTLLRNYRMAKGGLTKPLGDKGSAIANGAGQIAGSLLNTIDPTDKFGTRSGAGAAGSGAIKGAEALGALGPLGMGVGAVIGGIAGFVGNKKAQGVKQTYLTDSAKMAGEEQDTIVRDRIASDPSLMYGKQSSMYKIGGTLKGTHASKFSLGSAKIPMGNAAVDLLPDITIAPNKMNKFSNGGDAKEEMAEAKSGKVDSMSEETAEVKGKSHANGGVKFPKSGIELEGGETVSGDFVFSKELGFADIHKKIGMAMGKNEKRPETAINSNTQIALKRKEGYLKIAQEETKRQQGLPNEIDNSAQEMKEAQATKNTAMKNGGRFRKYALGGGDDKPKVYPRPGEGNIPINSKINLLAPTKGQMADDGTPMIYTTKKGNILSQGQWADNQKSKLPYTDKESFINHIDSYALPDEKNVAKVAGQAFQATPNAKSNNYQETQAKSYYGNGNYSTYKVSPAQNRAADSTQFVKQYRLDNQIVTSEQKAKMQYDKNKAAGVYKMGGELPKMSTGGDPKRIAQLKKQLADRKAFTSSDGFGETDKSYKETKALQAELNSLTGQTELMPERKVAAPFVKENKTNKEVEIARLESLIGGTKTPKGYRATPGSVATYTERKNRLQELKGNLQPQTQRMMGIPGMPEIVRKPQSPTETKIQKPKIGPSVEDTRNFLNSIKGSKNEQPAEQASSGTIKKDDSYKQKFNTRGDLVKFQELTGLKPDGIYGPKTKKLYEDLDSAGKSPGTAQRVDALAVNSKGLPVSNGLDVTMPELASAVTVGTKTNGTKSKFNLSDTADALAPFASNIANAFTKLPEPPKPTMDPTIATSLVDYSASRAEATRQRRGADKGAAAGLNSAAAVAATKAANLTQDVRAVNTINEGESNANTGIKNQTQQINASITRSNNSKTDAFNQSQVERQLKQQQLTSENIANASDKYQEIKKDKANMALEDDKMLLTIAQDNTGASIRAGSEILKRRLSPEGYTEMMSLGARLEKASAEERVSLLKRSNEILSGSAAAPPTVLADAKSQAAQDKSDNTRARTLKASSGYKKTK